MALLSPQQHGTFFMATTGQDFLAEYAPFIDCRQVKSGKLAEVFGCCSDWLEVRGRSSSCGATAESSEERDGRVRGRLGELWVLSRWQK